MPVWEDRRWPNETWADLFTLHTKFWTYPENISTARSSSPSFFRPALICSVYVGVSPFFQPSMIHSDSSSPFVGPPSQIAWPQTTMRWLGGCMLMVCSQRLGQKEVRAGSNRQRLFLESSERGQSGWIM